MATVTAAFQGITTPIADLYNEIHTRGWQVTKVDIKDGHYRAEASNPHGEKVEKYGRDANTALGALLMFIMRREYIRQGAWNNHWADKLESIAQSYAKAPHFDPKAAAAWKELADDCVARAHVLSQQLAIEVTHDPHPYVSPQDMWEDVQKHKHLLVSDAASEHPVWTRDQVIAFRICHDVLGHAAAGGDFGWTGTNLATAAHMPYLTPNAQQALFTETVGRSAYDNYHRGFGPQKICLLKEHLEPIQGLENPAGHGGEHPSMSLAPGVMPTRSGGVLRDPNYGYETNIIPPAGNAITLHDDPLEHMRVKDGAHALNTGWSQWQDHSGKPDLERMKAAVTNAFRAALLSPLKELKWNATHYQDISHIPHNTSDPKVYWDALENARINHNRAQGFPDPEIRHKAHYASLLDFYRYYARHFPQLSPSEVKEHADREVQIMQAEIEEALLHKTKDTDYEIIQPKVFKELDRRLKQIIKDDKPLHTAQVDDNPYDPNRQAYGGFIGRHLIAIAQVSKYADVLLEAALEDVKHNDGAGHIFRATALRLGIPYVGPKVVSFVWLLLQPLTSQLATIDSHMIEALGYKPKDVQNNRDYFGLERELMAGRDASGYGHMPLGQFQWGLWDYKRTGPGSHQDHTPLKAWEPTPHHQVEWAPKAVPNSNQHKADWVAPEWWNATQPYRDSERAAWQHDIAVKYPKGQIPWTDEPVFVPHTAADDGTQDETHLAIDVPEWVRKKIAEYVGTLDLAPSEIVDPAEYHITVAYASHGIEKVDVHTIRNQFNLTGLKFESESLRKLGDGGALVLELSNEDFDAYATRINDYLEDEGVDVTRYDDGYTPHITIAYTDKELSEEPLPLSFRGGPLSFSTPRAATPMPSLWARHAMHKLAVTFVCPNCDHEFGHTMPDVNVVKFCPQCGTSTFQNKYVEGEGYVKTPKIRPRENPDQTSIQSLLPTEVKWMDIHNRPTYDTHYDQRLTTAYDSQNNILYIGPTGTYHGHAGRHFGIPVEEGEYTNALTDNAPHFYVGYINLPYTPSRDDEHPQDLNLKGADMGWYHRTPPNADEIESAVGIEPKGEEAEMEWDDDMWGDDDDNPVEDQTSTTPDSITPDGVTIPHTKGEAPVGSTFTIGLPGGGQGPDVYKIVEQKPFSTAIGVEGSDAVGDHEPTDLWPPSWTYHPPDPNGPKPHPQTFGDAPQGSEWNSGYGVVYVIAHNNGTTVEVQVKSIDGSPPKNYAPYYYKVGDKFPSTWEPEEPRDETPVEPVSQHGQPLNVGDHVMLNKNYDDDSHYKVDGFHENGNVLLTNPHDDSIFEVPPYLTTHTPKGSVDEEIAHHEWKHKPTPGEQFTHPKFPGQTLTYEQQKAEGMDSWGSLVNLYLFKSDDGHTIQMPKSWLAELNPMALQKQSEPLDLSLPDDHDHFHPFQEDETVHLHGIPHTVHDVMDMSHEPNQGKPKQWYMMNEDTGQGEWMTHDEITNATTQPDQQTDTQDKHAVFARGMDGHSYRVSPWQGWGKSIDEWDAHDKAHVKYEAPDQPHSYLTTALANVPISHFAVRSADDPQWNGSPFVSVQHPSPGTFSRLLRRSGPKAKHRKRKHRVKPLRPAYGLPMAHCPWCTNAHYDSCPMHVPTGDSSAADSSGDAGGDAGMSAAASTELLKQAYYFTASNDPEVLQRVASQLAQKS